MAGSLRSWVVLAALGVGVAMQPTSGCEPESTEAPPGTERLLRDVGPEVVRPALMRLEAELGALDEAVAAWAAAPADGDAHDAARLAFLDSMAVWQELEVLQVGPAASSVADPDAGEDLRDELYSWPTVNPCRVDEETVEGAWSAHDFFQRNLVPAYGLDALEHLLWAGPDNACPGQVPINAEGTWDDLGPDGVRENRAAYAAALVEHIQVTTQILAEAWSPDGGDFGDRLASEDGPHASRREALNAVYDALFYLEVVTKDRKLLAPISCTADCAALIEGRASGSSVPWIRANLLGFRALFLGGEGFGFEDLLGELGHGDLADRVLANTDAALAVAEAASMPLDEALEAEPAQVRALHDAVQLITTDLKGDVATVLSLRLPAEAAGDND